MFLSSHFTNNSKIRDIIHSSEFCQVKDTPVDLLGYIISDVPTRLDQTPGVCPSSRTVARSSSDHLMASSAALVAALMSLLLASPVRPQDGGYFAEWPPCRSSAAHLQRFTANLPASSPLSSTCPQYPDIWLAYFNSPIHMLWLCPQHLVVAPSKAPVSKCFWAFAKGVFQVIPVLDTGDRMVSLFCRYCRALETVWTKKPRPRIKIPDQMQM